MATKYFTAMTRHIFKMYATKRNLPQHCLICQMSNQLSLCLSRLEQIIGPPEWDYNGITSLGFPLQQLSSVLRRKSSIICASLLQQTPLN